jgi:hypothetical protein
MNKNYSSQRLTSANLIRKEVAGQTSLKWTLVVLVILAFSSALKAQVNGDFRSAASSDWNNPGSWQRYNGAVWEGSGVGANNPGQVLGGPIRSGFRSAMLSR